MLEECSVTIVKCEQRTEKKSRKRELSKNKKVKHTKNGDSLYFIVLLHASVQNILLTMIFFIFILALGVLPHSSTPHLISIRVFAGFGHQSLCTSYLNNGGRLFSTEFLPFHLLDWMRKIESNNLPLSAIYLVRGMLCRFCYKPRAS